MSQERQRLRRLAKAFSRQSLQLDRDCALPKSSGVEAAAAKLLISRRSPQVLLLQSTVTQCHVKTAGTNVQTARLVRQQRRAHWGSGVRTPRGTCQHSHSVHAAAACACKPPTTKANSDPSTARRSLSGSLVNVRLQLIKCMRGIKFHRQSVHCCSRASCPPECRGLEVCHLLENIFGVNAGDSRGEVVCSCCLLIECMHSLGRFE